MTTETKNTSPTTIGNAAALERALRAATNKAEPSIVRVLQRAWADAAGVIRERDVVEAMAVGTLTPEAWARVQESIAETVAGPVAEQWERTAQLAAAYWGGAMVAARRRSPGWESIERRMLAWIERHGGALIRDINAMQRRAVNATISEYAVRMRKGPRETARVLRGMVGLTERQARAVARFQGALEADGVGGESLRRQVARYQMRIERTRARTIARTESVTAWSTAQRETMRAAMLRGDLATGTIEIWITADDERVCPECGPLHRKPANGRTSPLHPNCRCTVLWVEPAGVGRVDR